MAYNDNFLRSKTIEQVSKIAADMGPALDGDDAYIMRAIAHYRGQCSVRTHESMILLECIAACLLPLIPFLLLRGFFQRAPAPSQALAYFTFLGPINDNVAKLFKIPDELAETVTDKTFVPRRWKLAKSDYAILLRLFLALIKTRTPYPLQYLWKAFKDMALARGYLTHYPQARHAFIAGEYSCSISLIANQYKLANVPLYNVMHGDNASTPKESFFKIDRFYAWDAHYIDLFRDQRINAEFRVAHNPDFRLAANESIATSGIGVVLPMMNFLPEQYADFDALLADFKSKLQAGLSATAEPVSLRPHPAYMHTYSQTGLGYPMSDPRTESPHAFILRHKTLVGFYSTVLVEAAHLGARVMVIKSPGSVARDDYHGIFKMPHVRHVALNDLPEALAAFISADSNIMDGRHVA